MIMVMAVTSAVALIAPVIAAATPTTAATVLTTPTPATTAAVGIVSSAALSRWWASRPAASSIVTSAGRGCGHGDEPKPDLKILARPDHLRLDGLTTGNAAEPSAGGCLT